MIDPTVQSDGGWEVCRYQAVEVYDSAEAEMVSMLAGCSISVRCTPPKHIEPC